MQPLRRAAVEPGDTLCPQPRQKVCVVAVTDERPGVDADKFRIKPRYDRDLILPADGRKDRPNLRVSEGRVEVSGTILRARADLPGRRILDRDELRDLDETPNRLLVHRRNHTRSRK